MQKSLSIAELDADISACHQGFQTGATAGFAQHHKRSTGRCICKWFLHSGSVLRNADHADHAVLLLSKEWEDFHGSCSHLDGSFPQCRNTCCVQNAELWCFVTMLAKDDVFLYAGVCTAPQDQNQIAVGCYLLERCTVAPCTCPAAGTAMHHAIASL